MSGTRKKKGTLAQRFQGKSLGIPSFLCNFAAKLANRQ
jgi:hypothetical protein